jgi:hypothetical protein
VLAVLWVGLIVFVLTRGTHQESSVDVYSELPPGFTTALQQEGVTYTGLSPVDTGTVDRVMSHATTGSPLASAAGSPIVLRTSFTDRASGASFSDRAALMVVVPDGTGTGTVFVAFLDTTTYRTLTTLTYGGGASG